MLNTLQKNVDALHDTELEVDCLLIQKTIAISKYEKLYKIYQTQSENLEQVLNGQLVPKE